MINAFLVSLLILFSSLTTFQYYQTDNTIALNAVNNNGNKWGHKKPKPTPTPTPTATPTPSVSPTPTPTPTPIPLSMQIISPNGGEVLERGQVFRITWSSSPQIDTVTLGYKACDSCLDWIVNGIPNNGYYDWTVNVGNTSNTQFKIWIIGYQTGFGSVTDTSDNNFTVLSPSPTPTPVPTPTPTPTPTSYPLTISSVTTRSCTIGSSCYPYLVNIEVLGSGFATDSRVMLTQTTPGYNIYNGYYVGGNGSTQILTDFYDLPRCYQYKVTVYGSTGTATAPNTISSLCP